MDEQTARISLYVITAAGVVVWILALQFVNRAYRARHQARDRALQQMDFTGPAPDHLVFGTAELQGEPTALLAQATSLLLSQQAGGLGQLKILQRNDESVVFEGVRSAAGPEGSGQFVRRGRIQFSRISPGRTRVDYAVEISSGWGLLLGAGISLALGMIALVVGFLLINTLVVPHVNPQVRGQTLQMLQVCHLLWPPFLFGALYRRQYSVVSARLDTLIHNLPYYQEASR